MSRCRPPQILVCEGRPEAGAGVVDQDGEVVVMPGEGGIDVIEQRRQALPVGQVTGQGRGGDAMAGGQFIGQLVQQLFAAGDQDQVQAARERHWPESTA